MTNLNKLKEIVGLYPRKLAFFVGAGLSKPLIPNWTELLRDLIDLAENTVSSDFPATELKNKLSKDSDSLLDIAQECKIALTSDMYRNFLEDKIGVNIEADNVNMIWKSILRFEPEIILTTNWDRIPEIVTEGKYTPFTPRNISEAKRALRKEQPIIFKIHGCISDNQSIVFTKDDYSHLMFEDSRLRTFLQYLFSQYYVVFLGFSFQDPHLDLILSYMRIQDAGIPNSHFAIMPKSSDLDLRILERNYCIRSITYNSDEGHGAVVEYLDSLTSIKPEVDTSDSSGSILSNLKKTLLERTGHTRFFFNVVSSELLHLSVLSLSNSQMELQKEVLSICNGITGDTEGINSVRLCIHTISSDKECYAFFMPSILIVKGSIINIISYSNGDSSQAELWNSLSFFQETEIAPGMCSVKPLDFPFIGVR